MSVGLVQVGGEVAGTAMRHRDRVRSAADMDVERREGIAYEYLCHLEEAKKWVEYLPATIVDKFYGILCAKGVIQETPKILIRKYILPNYLSEVSSSKNSTELKVL